MMKIEFDKDKHIYTVNGETKPSVTRLLSWALHEDLSFVNEDVLRRAREYGEKFHKLTQDYDYGLINVQDAPEIFLKPLKSWADWIEQYEILHIEMPMYANGVCGTPDRILVNKETRRLIVADLKTSTTLPRKIGLQLSYYSDMYCDYANIAWDDMDLLAVQIDENGNLKTKKYENETIVCRAITTLWEWDNRFKRNK